MDKILMCNKLQTNTVKPNFFSTPNLEKLQQWASVGIVDASIMAGWLRKGSWTWFPPSGQYSTTKGKKFWATVVASFMAKWLCKYNWTWFPPSGRHSTGLCYAGVGINGHRWLLPLWPSGYILVSGCGSLPSVGIPQHKGKSFGRVRGVLEGRGKAFFKKFLPPPPESFLFSLGSRTRACARIYTGKCRKGEEKRNF